MTVESILDAAIQVFERHGYDAGTTSRIAERAGVSVGSLYQYFPNKDAILVAVAQRHLEEAEAALERMLAASVGHEPLERVARRFVEGMLALHEQHPAVHQMLFEEVALPALVRQVVEELERKAIGAVAELLRKRSDTRIADPLLAATLVVQLVEAMTHRLVLHPPSNISQQDCVNELVALITGYVMGCGTAG